MNPGARLGPYEIVTPLGAGGMGEVYRARDTRLGRDVAIKVLPEAFASDPDRLARFEREAQVLAALNHPHIAQIYGLEEGPPEGGLHESAVGSGFSRTMRALVMELVDGGTLADRIASGPVPVGEALAIAKQIADALEAAHEKGIVHRDLKPSNIAFTTDGQVKVLDFGLAKLAAPDVASPARVSPLSMSPTITTPALLTGAGMLMGTAAYMAPEQVKGREADKRSDVWAFGCVLYEMLTGVRPFEAEDVAETLAFALTKEPDWSKLPPDLPPAVAVLLRRCMAKDRRKRIGDVAAVQFVLEESAGIALAAAPATAAPPRLSPWRRGPMIAALLVVAVALTGVGVWQYARLDLITPPVVRFTVTPANAPLVLPSPGTAGLLVDHALAITPDGKQVIYRAGTMQAPTGDGPRTALMVRPLDQLDAHPLVQGDVREPTVSPDGRWVAFFQADGLRKVSMTGGPSILVARVINGNVRGLSWGDDNTLVFAMDAAAASTLYTVPAGGGDPRVLLAPDPAHDDAGYWFPSVLPGAHAVLFTTYTTALAPRVLAIRAPADNGQLGVVDLRTGRRKTLLRGGSDAHYVRSGHLVYTAGGSLRAVPFDLGRLEVTGDPVPVVDSVGVGAVGEAEFAVSPTGTLVYVPASSIGAAAETQLSLAWVDRHGREEPVSAPARSYTYPRISPDGTKAVLDIRDREDDLWTWDFARRTLTRLTFDSGIDRAPILSPDGKRVFFTSQRDGVNSGGNLFVQATDGTGTAVRLTTSPDTEYPNSISPDGTRIVFRQDSRTSKSDLMLLTLGGGKGRVTPLVQTMFNERNGEIAPDGRWLAYESDESGQYQVYVRPFPQVDGGRWQVSPAGGTRPVWARNGRELFYLNATQQLMAVAVQTTPTFSAGNPVKLFDTSYATPNTGVTYDVSPDGQRFLVIKENAATDAKASGAPSPSLVFVLNWFGELKQRVAGK